MNHSRRNGSEREEGFTLIELLLVVIILGILSAVVVFSVRGVKDRGGASACESSRATIRISVESYFARHAAYPSTLIDLGAEFLEDVDTAITTGPAPYANTLEGGPGKWTFHYSLSSPSSFDITPCVMLT